MNKQTIISIGRQFGSGGREIAGRIAEDLGLEIMDANILMQVAKKNDMTYEQLMKYDERRVIPFLSARYQNFSASLETNVAEAQFHEIRRHAESGQSFVIVGRCADAVLEGYEGLITIFITADEKVRTERTAALYHLDPKKAAAMNRKVDARRKAYHDRFSDRKWGQADAYDLILRQSSVGIDRTVELIERYIRFRQEIREEEDKK